MAITTPFIDVLPRLASHEREALESRIASEDGVHDPVLLTEHEEVLDGHARLELDPDAPTVVVAGSADWSEAQKKAFIYRTNCGRRNLSPEQHAESIGACKRIAKELKDEGRPYDDVAAMLGVPLKTVARWVGGHDSQLRNVSTDCRQKLTRKQCEEVVRRVEAGDTHEHLAAEFKVSTKTIQRAIRKVKPKDKRDKAELPDDAVVVTDLAELDGKTFGTIYADPPWQYGNQQTRAATDDHYDTMTIEQICAMPIGKLAAKDAHLHLWTTNGFLREAFQLIDAWGFEYKSCAVWCKPQLGIGNYVRVSHEFVLIGVRGDAKNFRTSNVKSWFECDRERHSAKPRYWREIIEDNSPGPFLEIFSRQAVRGWTVFGNEVSTEIQETFL